MKKRQGHWHEQTHSNSLLKSTIPTVAQCWSSSILFTPQTHFCSVSSRRSFISSFSMLTANVIYPHKGQTRSGRGEKTTKSRQVQKKKRMRQIQIQKPLRRKQTLEKLISKSLFFSLHQGQSQQASLCTKYAFPRNTLPYKSQQWVFQGQNIMPTAPLRKSSGGQYVGSKLLYTTDTYKYELATYLHMTLRSVNS